MSKHVVNTCGYAHIRPRSKRTKEKTLSSSRQWKSSRAPSWSSHLKYHQYPSLEIPIQTPCRFPQIFPSSLSEYPLKNSHPNTRGNFVLSLYESLRKIPRTPPYISPWKSFSRCGEFFSNPNSKPFKHKLENLFPSLFSPLTPRPSLALPHFPFFLHRPNKLLEPNRTPLSLPRRPVSHPTGLARQPCGPPVPWPSLAPGAPCQP